MFPRSQQAAIERATECKVQAMSAFGVTHPLAHQAKALEEALIAEAKRQAEPKTLVEVFESSEPQPLPPAVEPGPA